MSSPVVKASVYIVKSSSTADEALSGMRDKFALEAAQAMRKHDTDLTVDRQYINGLKLAVETAIEATHDNNDLHIIAIVTDCDTTGINKEALLNSLRGCSPKLFLAFVIATHQFETIDREFMGNATGNSVNIIAAYPEHRVQHSFWRTLKPWLEAQL